ncbi:hypothetical protein AYX13_07080 [Cryptococcus neoformans]|nr:hypothetical protein AYX13_07080 [Cryptococcus neoformans var. grubii]
MTGQRRQAYNVLLGHSAMTGLYEKELDLTILSIVAKAFENALVTGKKRRNE